MKTRLSVMVPPPLPIHLLLFRTTVRLGDCLQRPGPPQEHTGHATIAQLGSEFLDFMGDHQDHSRFDHASALSKTCTWPQVHFTRGASPERCCNSMPGPSFHGKSAVPLDW